MLGKTIPDIFFLAKRGKVITNPDLGIETRPYSEITNHDILLIPGGMGTRKLVNDSVFIDVLKDLAQKSENVLSICTFSLF